MTWYYHIRLWYWWKFIINRYEFSTKLEYRYLYDKYKSIPSYSKEQLATIMTGQRNIAHRLDAGERITNISPKLIKLARI